jgi:ATP-dependent helicase HrpA
VSGSTSTPTVEALRQQLPGLMLRDEHRLQRRLGGVRKVRDAAQRRRLLASLEAEVQNAVARVEARRARVPRAHYPEELPVSARREDLMAAIRDHQVVIVAGETGSGKTTQLPKICLELGCGVRGLIGHTQPRRIAARSVAERIAEELGVAVGDTVGYTVRFVDRAREDTLVKVMTDGILLAEIQRDRSLLRYDTLIIDEAHERSLNLDFILGYLKQLLPRRPDLKVVVTSATIDPQRFAQHFGNAPVVEVSGRTFPVEVRYRPLSGANALKAADDERDQVQAIVDAVAELDREGGEGPSDTLVFLSGEREIRDAADALRKAGRGAEILPLYARLSAAEQHRVFQPHAGRRIVLATNVAETSLTVPGIRYVVDPGTARISRYSNRTKVQRLPIEKISQASANQRKGRCGRVSEGVCIRLYSEEDFESRPEFTEPEILRTNLASVILQMAVLRLGDMAEFPFLDPPDRRQVRDGIQLLEELGALHPTTGDPHSRLTEVGRRLAAFPVDPRIGRMVLEADRNGCVAEVLVIAAGLSIQDPRERPADQEEAARQKHARFRDETSDFLAFLNLWRFVEEQQSKLSLNQFRKLCRTDFLNYLRVREWQDLVAQLRQVARSIGIDVNSSAADPGNVHQALLAGLLSHIGLKSDDRDFLGARGTRFGIFPGSALFKKPPRWVMAGELVETSRLWARVNARIEPGWIEPLAGHLVRRSYSEPHWDKDLGAVMAFEKVTLYGVPIVTERKVAYGRIDPVLSRELFIRHALVEGDWRTHQTFWHENRARAGEILQIEERARRRDVLIDGETLYGLYDERIPADVVSQRHFDSWWKSARRTDPGLLSFSTQMLTAADADRVAEAEYPDAWDARGMQFALDYRFDPGTPGDGVTVTVPVAALNRLTPGDFEWQVPGLREELVTGLIRTLPKPIRRNLVPAADYAQRALVRLDPRREALLPALERVLADIAGVRINPADWAPDRLSPHLRMTFRVTDDSGAVLGEGKDLSELKERLAPAVARTVSRAAASIERAGLTTWDFELLATTFEMSRDGELVRGYPALVDEGAAAAIRVLDTRQAAGRAHRAGVRKLLLLAVPPPHSAVAGALGNKDKLALGRNPYGNVSALLDDCAAAAVDSLVAESGGPPREREVFDRLRAAVRAGLPDRLRQVVRAVAEALAGAHEVELRLAAPSLGATPASPALADVRAQLSRLIRPGFVSAIGWPRIADLERYERAMLLRIERLPGRIERDRQLMASVLELEAEWRELAAGAPLESPPDEELAEVRWMLEELRVSLFAQALRTPYPVSEKRVLAALDALTA